MFHILALFCLCWCRLIDAVKSVSVMEKDSVTLHTDVTQIQEDDNIIWKYGIKNIPIAEISKEKQTFSTYDVLDRRFRERLKLDNQTGSLTITNITTEHTGLYKLEIIGAELSTKTFSVSVYTHLPVPVIIRNSSQCSSSSCSVVCSVVNVSHVTLSWLKGNSLLSSISVSNLSISLSLPLEVEDQDTNNYSCVLNNSITHQTTHLDISRLCLPCEDRLKLDDKNGSLTITTEHTGQYEVKTIADDLSSKTFNISINNRLKLDDKTESLTITNTTTKHTGQHEDKTIGDELSSETFNISDYNSAHSCCSTEAVLRLVLSALVGVAIVAVLVYDIISRWAEQA